VPRCSRWPAGRAEVLLAHHEVVVSAATVLLGGAGVSLGVLRALLRERWRRDADRATARDVGT